MARLILEPATELRTPLRRAPDATELPAFSVSISGPRFEADYRGVVRFRFRRDSPVVRAAAARGLSEEFVEDVFSRELMPLIEQLWGREVVHASAVWTSLGALAFCGESGAGKSTMAHVFGLRGYPVLADDAVIIDSTIPARITPRPFRLRLRPGAASFFSANGPPAAHGSQSRGPLPLRALIMLEREDRADGAVKLRRLTPVESFRTLLSHAYCLSLEDLERKARMVEHYFDLAEHVPAFRAEFPAGLEKLTGVAARIEQELLDST